MSESSKSRWIVAGLCGFAANRVFVFAAAFPFFKNVDEQAHIDLVLKYAHGHLPHSIEPFSKEAAHYLALYRTPEYFVPPQEYGGQYPPPNWTLSLNDQQRVLDQEAAAWESRDNHEAGEPPIYYAIAGTWFDLGRSLGLSELISLYWVRFLNVVLAAVLVWLGYKAALIVFREQQSPAIATATLLAVWPQSSFYSVQGDSLAAITFGLAFIAMAKLLTLERPKILLGIGAGLAVAATCLIKTANLPLVFILFGAVILKTTRLARKGESGRGLSVLAGFVISIAVPLGIWFAWNEHYFGDLTATKSKIDLLGWTPKTFGEWWSHPIFTLAGAKDFWSELMASFWRGEFIWHGARMATWWSDAFYLSVSTIVLAIAVVSLFVRRHSEPNRAALWFALLSFAALVAFLVLLSVRFDFGQCPYPSRERPYFTSGRLLNAAAVPFFLLFAYAIQEIARWAKRASVQWILLGAITLLVLTWQVSVNAQVLSSQYNFFHR